MAKHEFKVNGMEFEAGTSKLTAAEVLEIAREAAPAKVDEWVLDGDKGQYKGDDEIDLNDDSVFTAVPVGPTPVADCGRTP